MTDSPQEKFSVLIIGCGAIAGGYDAEDIEGPNILTHAKAFKLHDGFNLAGCLDTDLKIAQDFADSWGVEKAYKNLEEAMADRNFDIISICTSTPGHVPYLRQLQKYNVRFVFCEKPIADDLQAAREMAALYPDNMAVNYIRRFDPKIRRLARGIQDKKYGSLLSGEARYTKGLYNNGSHMADLIGMLLGKITVKASDAIIYDFWPDDPTISATLEVACGGQIDLIGSDVAAGMVFDLELMFDQAIIRLTDFSQALAIKPVNGPETIFRTTPNREMLDAVSNIYDHLTEGAELQSKAVNGLSALETCEDIRRMAGIS